MCHHLTTTPTTMLKPRQAAILASVVERYVESAEPVGSGALASDPRLAAFGTPSSATIRNELAELEELGFLSHPHTSAGRVPTDLGYRFYVSQMLRPRAVTRQERSQIELVAPPAASVEDAMREAMVVLARLTGYPAVASLPTASRDTLRMLQLNAVPPRRLVLVLVTTAGRIEHRLFEIGEEVSPTKLQTVVNWLNDVLGGLSLAGARNLSFEEVSRGLHEASAIDLARRAWEIVRDSVADIADDKIVVQGLITLLDEPEFSDIGQARAALRVLEDEAAMGGVLRVVPEGAETVRIGRELPPLDASNEGGPFFSFVGISYGVAGQNWGALGVLGPSRMRYVDALSLVPALARRLQATLETL